jgi:cardiolipin synthase
MITLSVWGAVLCLLIIIGLLLLLGVYLAGTFRPTQQYHLTGIPPSQPHFLMTVASLSDSLITAGEACQFWSDIDAIQQARLNLIEQAEDLIQFETFKMTPGQRADAFAEALCRQAIAGVKVQVLADSYGAKDLPPAYWHRLQRSGVEIRFFNPFQGRSPLDYLRRNHRKLLVIDQQVALVGGAGISDLWDGRDGKSGQVPWYDFEVQWRGAVVGLLTGFFWQHWLSAGGQVNLHEHRPDQSLSTTAPPVLITPGEEPSTGDSPIRSLFQLCILSAQKRLWIASPYLLPDTVTCRMLGSVCDQGVDVRILTMGPKSDKAYVYYTARERYGALLKQGIQIYEYQPSMMHGKIILIDQHWVSLGSANLDPRSFFHNDELNLCTDQPALISQVEDFFVAGWYQSQRIELPDWQKRPYQERAIGRLGNFLYWQL